MNYYSYVVVQNIAVVQTYPNFPDVTICNLFPISDRQNFDDRYQSYLQTLDFLRSNQKSPEDFRTNDGFWYFLRSLIVYNVNTLDHRTDTQDYPNEDGFVLECRQNQWDLFNGVDCPLALEYDRPLQKCVRIQPVLNETALIKIMLFIDDFWSDVIDSFYSWTRMPMSTGVRVMVHAHGSKPDTKKSIFVEPGSDLTITVKQTNITRLLYPRGNCTNQRLMEPDRLDSYLYNQATCISLCRQRQIMQTCHCIDTFETFTDVELHAVNGTFCLNVTQFLSDLPLSNDSVVDDVWKLLRCWWNVNPVEEICDCPVSCFDINYDFVVSGARWPSAVYQLAFYERYLRGTTHYDAKFAAYETIEAERRPLNRSRTLKRIRDMKLIDDNFLQVTVVMNDRSVTTITDILAMSWDTMASNLGGALNLWLGISVLTAAEIVELLYSVIQILLNKKRTDVETTDNRQPNSEITR